MSEPAAPEAPVRVPRQASHPFNKPEADIILRSSDQVDFRVRRHILLEASPVFESILSIPQPPSTSEATPTLPIVDLTEDSHTLDILLRICYPIVKPATTRSFDQIESALKAAQKYEMELALAMLTDELQAAIPRSPLEVWAVACRTRLETVARAVAQHTLDTPTLDFTILGRMKGICAGDYYRFLQFRRLKGNVEGLFQFLDPPSEPIAIATGSKPAAIRVDEGPELPYPDIACQSLDGTTFLAHKAFISAASPVLQKEIDALLPLQKEIDALLPSNDISLASTLPVLPISVNGDILPDLIRLCYFRTMKLPYDPRRFGAILAAARKYDMKRIAEDVYSRWEKVASFDPLNAYLVACLYDLNDCARQAAKQSLEQKNIDSIYRHTMERCPAISYHNLLRYHHTCGEVRADAFSGIVLSLKAPTKMASLDEDMWGPAPATTPRAKHRRPRERADTSDWLLEYVKTLSKTAAEHPGQVLDYSGSKLFDDAIAAGQWCSSCRLFAGELSRVASDLKGIPAKVQAVYLRI